MKRLAKIQRELKVPKNQYNAFGEYKFRSAEDILEAVKPLLGDLTLLLSDEVVLIGERYYIKATARLFDGNGKLIAEVYAYAREAENKKKMDVSQVSGATSSYARKYALKGLFAIDDTKDADATNKHGKEKEKTSAPKNPSAPAQKSDKPTAQKQDSKKSKYKTYLDSMAQLKEEVKQKTGSYDKYYEALMVYNAEHANDIKNLTDGRDVYNMLKNFLKTLDKTQGEE